MFDNLFEGVSSIVNKLLFMFPESPFQKVTVAFEIENFLNYLNWFVPFDLAVNITEAWLIGIFAWKVYGKLFMKVKV